MLSKVKLVVVRWAAEFGSLPRRFKQTVGGVIAIALVVGAIFLGRTIHHHVANQSTPKKPVAAQASKSKPAQAPGPKKSGDSKSSLAKGFRHNSSAIPNTGPGDVAAIFAGATVAGALAHFSISRRRQNS